MRRQVIALCLRATPPLLAIFPGSSKEEAERLEKVRQEAADKGFARRDTVDGQVFLVKEFKGAEEIESGVAVANLPAKTKEHTEFDQYQRSTTDFSSIVTPHGVAGVGLGAGFGARPDKRLGFLRPKQTLQPFSGIASITPKFDENGVPIDETLSRSDAIKKRMDYIKSFEGMTMSRKEHFLLVDLDFDKDSIIFGNTREEFERNVEKLRNVITTYTKWERTDNFYYYSTIVLKLLTLWVLMECVHQYYERELLASHYDLFAEVMEGEIASLEETRKRDFTQARQDLQQNPPDFKPVVAAILREKRRLEEAAATAKAEEEEEGKLVDPVKQAAKTVENALQTSPAAPDGATNSTSAPASPSPRKTTFDWSRRTATGANPMDTTGELDYRERKRREEEEREMRRLHERSTSQKHFRWWSALIGKVHHSPSAPLQAPLQQEDFARFSYAASPTSIEVVRHVRRLLLPRSEDYTQAVREEMAEYRRSKEAESVHPQ